MQIATPYSYITSFISFCIYEHDRFPVVNWREEGWRKKDEDIEARAWQSNGSIIVSSARLLLFTLTKMHFYTSIQFIQFFIGRFLFSFMHWWLIRTLSILVLLLSFPHAMDMGFTGTIFYTHGQTFIVWECRSSYTLSEMIKEMHLIWIRSNLEVQWKLDMLRSCTCRMQCDGEVRNNRETGIL